MSDETGIIPSLSISTFLAQHGEILAHLEAAQASLKKAEALAKAAIESDDSVRFGFQFVLYGGGHHVELFACGMDPIRKRLDAAAWHRLMKGTGLQSFMDHTAREEWEKLIETATTPELTPENITATFHAMHDTRSQMFERGVVETFKKLSWDYKTNSPVKFGKRLVIRYLCSWPGSFECRTVDQLEDLQRVFCLLDGKPEEDRRVGIYHRLYAAQKQNGFSAHRGVHQDTYMEIKWFKNRNGHVTFRRPDLVAELNRILARHYPNALPPSTEDL